tara:strand:+ start:14 stop:850 length:837 start_codon:yes stop_codon:yes gene_type:complete
MGFIGKQPAKAAMTSSDITDGIVSADKLASSAVTTAKIADNGVTTAKINADAVTDAKIADDIVGTEHLTAGEVDTTALGADAVTAAKIADDAISDEHLDPTAITGQTAETSVANDDLVLVSDTSASAALRKMTVSNLVANAGGGKVLQVVQGTKTDSTLSTSSSYVATGLNVDITPSATSSKVLVMVSAYIDSNAGTVQKYATIYRDSTDLGSGTGGLTAAYNGGGRLRSAMNMSILDSPSTTSEITYEMYMKNVSGANIQINSESGKVTIIAMEIGA